MSPTLRPPEEVRLKRTAMSTRELRRAEVLARMKSRTLRLVDAAKMLELSLSAGEESLAAVSVRRSRNRVDTGGHAGRERLPGANCQIRKGRGNPNDMPNIHVCDKIVRSDRTDK